jgi:hypothetical protein
MHILSPLLLTVVWSFIALTAWAQPPAARHHLRTHGQVRLPAEVVTCQPGQLVGVWLEDDGAAVHLQDVGLAVQGCAIGLLVQAHADVAVRVSGVAVQHLPQAQQLLPPLNPSSYRVGFQLEGVGGVADHNVAVGMTDGFVILGSQWTITNNTASDMRHDGFFLPYGFGNLLQGNIAERNGEVGIHVSQIRLQQTRGRNLPFPAPPVGNMITQNQAHDNGLFDLADYNQDCSSDATLRRNTWIQNDFGTTNRPCFN